jgi:hypothetical protein
VREEDDFCCVVLYARRRCCQPLAFQSLQSAAVHSKTKFHKQHDTKRKNTLLRGRGDPPMIFSCSSSGSPSRRNSASRANRLRIARWGAGLRAQGLAAWCSNSMHGVCVCVYDAGEPKGRPVATHPAPAAARDWGSCGCAEPVLCYARVPGCCCVTTAQLWLLPHAGPRQGAARWRGVPAAVLLC